MNRDIEIDDLAKAISQELESYSEEVTEKVKEVIDQVADEVMKEIKTHVKFKEISGDYVKAFRIKTLENTKYNKTKVWHVLKPFYRLTHLLEKGHALRNGKRSRAFPHIEYGEKLAQKRLVELTKGAIENIGD